MPYGIANQRGSNPPSKRMSQQITKAFSRRKENIMEPMKEEFCEGCNHQIGRHYKDVNGVVRCLVIERHISSSGLSGFLSDHICDCTDYVSESTTKERQRKAEEKRKFEEQVNKITDDIKENLAQKDSGELAICTTSGKPIDEHTREINPATGQQNDYIVLCESERAKGFVRPYRDSYKHVGTRPKFPLRELSSEETERYKEIGYVAFEAYPKDESSLVGRYWTQTQLDSGCGTVTTMNKALSETWARNNKFYGATFCCECGEHFPVDEFIWTADGQTVGS